MGILKRMRVIEGSAFVAVPLTGMTLGQMGAKLIQFDHIEGGMDANRWPVTQTGQSLFWAGLNTGNKSVAANIKSPQGRELITRIITAPSADAGLFLTNLRVCGWLDHDSLSRHRPDLIMVSLLTEETAAPVAQVLPAWNCIAGNMAVTALLAAERHCLRTGLGQKVVFSLKDVAAVMLGNLRIIGEVAFNGTDSPEYANALYGGYGQDFICADGARFTHLAAITALLAPLFSRHRVADFAASFDRAGVTWSQFRSFAQAMAEDHDLSPDNPLFYMVDQPGIGRCATPASPVDFFQPLPTTHARRRPRLARIPKKFWPMWRDNQMAKLQGFSMRAS